MEKNKSFANPRKGEKNKRVYQEGRLFCFQRGVFEQFKKRIKLIVEDG
jgi:hypothetical protein